MSLHACTSFLAKHAPISHQAACNPRVYMAPAARLQLAARGPYLIYLAQSGVRIIGEVRRGDEHVRVSALHAGMGIRTTGQHLGTNPTSRGHSNCRVWVHLGRCDTPAFQVL